MKKRIVIILISLIVVCFGLFQFFTTGLSVLVSPEEKSIKTKIETFLRAQHGWASKKKLEKIVTPDFQNNTRDFTNLYSDGLKFYTIEKFFMNSRREIDSETIEIHVKIYNPDIKYAYFTLKKSESGEYLIENIEFGV